MDLLPCLVKFSTTKLVVNTMGRLCCQAEKGPFLAQGKGLGQLVDRHYKSYWEMSRDTSV